MQAPSKKLRIINLNEHAVPVQCPKQAVQYPTEQQPPNTQKTKSKSLERLFNIAPKRNPKFKKKVCKFSWPKLKTCNAFFDHAPKENPKF